MSETTGCQVRDVPIGRCYDNTLTKPLWLRCHIQWLYLAVHGCKTYLNLNLSGFLRGRPEPTTVPSGAGHTVPALLQSEGLGGVRPLMTVNSCTRAGVSRQGGSLSTTNS
jgi:hypothetical protein